MLGGGIKISGAGVNLILTTNAAEPIKKRDVTRSAAKSAFKPRGRDRYSLLHLLSWAV